MKAYNNLITESLDIIRNAQYYAFQIIWILIFSIDMFFKYIFISLWGGIYGSNLKIEGIKNRKNS